MKSYPLTKLEREQLARIVAGHLESTGETMTDLVGTMEMTGQKMSDFLRELAKYADLGTCFPFYLLTPRQANGLMHNIVKSRLKAESLRNREE